MVVAHKRQEAALAWLEGLGYAVLHGPDIAFDAPRAEQRAAAINGLWRSLITKYERQRLLCCIDERQTSKSLGIGGA